MRYMRSLKEWQRSLSKYDWSFPNEPTTTTDLPFTPKDIGEESLKRLQNQGKACPASLIRKRRLALCR
eukprot:10207676-Prorocentrum_lima.AAC.1